VPDLVTYVALLRGVGPANPATRNDRLRAAFEALGFTGVRPVISSGNVVFDADGEADAGQLEARIEDGLASQVGSRVGTIVRSRERLRALVDLDPFAGVPLEPGTVLNVTFLKNSSAADLEYPHRPEGKPYTVLCEVDGALCTVVPSGGPGTSDVMTWIERRFGKAVTTRTYRTVGRILAAMDSTRS
jgi:uncharacterized protein (DUF1697 family)